VTANVNLFQADSPKTESTQILDPDPQKLLSGIIELPVHSSRLRDVLRGSAVNDPNGIVLRSCATVGEVNPLEYADQTAEQMHAVGQCKEHFGFDPLQPNLQEKRTLVRHASYCGEAYYLYDYYDRLPWRTEVEGVEAVDQGRLPAPVRFLSDLCPLAKSGADAICLIVPLVDDDGDYCIGSINIEGSAPAPYLDPMDIYLVQHLARSATEQIRKMRFRHARDSIRNSATRVLEENLNEQAVLMRLDDACKVVAKCIGNRCEAQFFELAAKRYHSVAAGDPIRLAPLPAGAPDDSTLGMLIARLGYTPVHPPKPFDARGMTSTLWRGLRYDRRADAERKWQQLEYRYHSDAGPRVVLTDVPTERASDDPHGSLADCCLAYEFAGGAANVLFVPLFAPYGQPFDQTMTFCAGVLMLRSPQSWKSILESGDTGLLVTELRELATLLQRGRMQPLALANAELHEQRNPTSFKEKLLQKMRWIGPDSSKYPRIAATLEFWERVLKNAFTDPPSAKTFFDGTWREELDWLVSWNQDEGDLPKDWDAWTRARLVALDNFLRNCKGKVIPKIERGTSLTIEGKISEAGMAIAYRQLRWFPYGRPGRGRFVAHVLVRRFERSVANERIVKGAWRVTIERVIDDDFAKGGTK